MDQLLNRIVEKRPNLAKNTVNTYFILLKHLFLDVFPGKEVDYQLFLSEYKQVVEWLMSNKKTNTRKTILSALTIICNDADPAKTFYKLQMMADAEEYTALQKTNHKSEKEEANWLSWKEVTDKLEELKKKYTYIFKASNPSPKEVYEAQQYILLACYVLVPPRRCLDFSEMKVNNFDVTVDNYYLKGNFFFSKYKTSKFSGLQVVHTPKTLDYILKKWISVHKHDYLFSDKLGKPLTANGMSKLLSTIFEPKSISVNMLRHIYITEHCAPLIDTLKQTALDMGHSVEQQQTYVKVES